MIAEPNLLITLPEAGNLTILRGKSLVCTKCAYRAISTGPWAGAAYTLAPNKANCPRFWLGNEGLAQKQSQSKPIQSASHGLAVRNGQIRSTKLEARNKSKTQRTQMAETSPPGRSGVWDFGFEALGLASSFDIRISCFRRLGTRAMDVIIGAKQSQFPETENVANISNGKGLPGIWPVPGREKQSQFPGRTPWCSDSAVGFLGTLRGPCLKRGRALPEIR